MTDYSIIHSPTPSEVETALTEDRHTKQQTVTCFVRAEVIYNGKNATAELDSGDRLIICKPDDSLVVHTSTGCDATNWMTPGSTVTVIQDTPLTITARQTDPRQQLKITIDEIYYITLAGMDSDAALSLQGTEQDMQKYVYDNPTVVEDGLRTIERERGTPAGPVDIWGQDSTATPVALELKRRQATPGNVEQLHRYMKHFPDNTRGVLVAPDISDNAADLLSNYGLEFVPVTPPSGIDQPDSKLTDFS